MGAKDIYTVKTFSATTEGVYKCVKMDADLNPLEEYVINELDGAGASMVCTCFAGGRSTCRHRQMVRLFEAEQKIDKGWMYQFDQKKWIEPLTQDV